MKRFLFKLSLFLSAFTPLYLLITLNLVLEILNDNLHFNVLNTTLLVLMIILITCGVIGVVVLLKPKATGDEILVLDSSNITDQHFLGYFSLFVLFALSFDLSKVSYSCVFLLIQILIALVYIKNNMFYINPLLNIIGYSLFNITYKDINLNKIKTTKVFYKGNFKTHENFTLTSKLNILNIVSKNKLSKT